MREKKIKTRKISWITVRTTPALKKRLVDMSDDYGLSLASLSTMVIRIGLRSLTKLKGVKVK